MLLNAAEAAATLDCIASLACVAREYGWVRPRLVEESVFDVVGARHPVAELIANKSGVYVPNPIQ